MSVAERMQRVGDWEVSKAAFRRCLSSGFMTAADFNLSLSQLSERMDCATAACDCVRSASFSLTVSELRSMLLRDFDEYTVSWVLSDFAGLTLVPFGSTYVVEVS